MNESCYGFFSAPANPTRLAILETLVDGELSFSGLAEALGQGHSVVTTLLRRWSGAASCSPRFRAGGSTIS